MSQGITTLSRWKFDIQEVSANVYTVVGIDDKGRQVSTTGTNIDAALEDCKTEASKIENTHRSRDA